MLNLKISDFNWVPICELTSLFICLCYPKCECMVNTHNKQILNKIISQKKEFIEPGFVAAATYPLQTASMRVENSAIGWIYHHSHVSVDILHQ